MLPLLLSLDSINAPLSILLRVIEIVSSTTVSRDLSFYSTHTRKIGTR